jgi:hypothetical protein
MSIKQSSLRKEVILPPGNSFRKRLKLTKEGGHSSQGKEKRELQLL